jgi:phosphoribosylformylglycinamidine synthase
VIKNIKNHISRGGAVLGICNGFQILIEAGILPGSLIRNKRLLFTCRNTTLKVQDSMKSPFITGLKKGDYLNIPVAHNEGNFFGSEELLNELTNDGRIAFKYVKQTNSYDEYNPNGSSNDIAGILSKNGKVLGMMPHPERAINHLHGGTDGFQFLSKCFQQIVG